MRNVYACTHEAYTLTSYSFWVKYILYVHAWIVVPVRLKNVRGCMCKQPEFVDNKIVLCHWKVMLQKL